MIIIPEIQIQHGKVITRAAIEGDVEKGSLMAGQSVGLADKIMPIKGIIDELVHDAEAELQKLKQKLSAL